ncbi:oligosaccharide flippase family protein [Altericroceibacterium endophyticum]|uniref:Oligosaccharide flippase family protein n=1 Tax=Altericroceibacterium endophyticum TaxID=1808508 RepID=A0A6I4T5Z2_9SPHN|nr:oligosaccharide flippase family protein [Altericroceibacterium endophyticum]MXO65205.1 oligosaccharide flippase family protein [Altericroceibacterium endophyticum]
MSVRSAALWAASSQYFGFILQFISSVVIARYFLGPEEFGVFSVAFSAAALVHGLQDFGLNRHIVGARQLGRKQIRQSVSISVVVALFIAVVIMAMAWPLALIYGNDDLVAITLVIGVSFLFIPFSVTSTALLQRDMDFRRCAFVDIGSNILNVTVLIGSAALGYSSLSLAIGVFSYQMSRAILAQYFRPIWRDLRLTYRGSFSMFRYGLSSSLVSLTGSASSNGPSLIIGKMISEAALGFYGRATGLALQFRLLVGGPIGAVFYPSLARARDRGENLGDRYIALTAALCAVTWAAMAGLAVAAEPLILIVYGDIWRETAPVLFWIALSQIFFIAIPMQIEVAYLMGGWKKIIWLTLAETIISLLLLAIFARYGLVWAAMSRMLHGVIWWMLHAFFIRRLVGFSWRSLLTVYAKTALAALVAVVPLLAGYRFWMAPADMTLIPLIALSCGGVVLWALALHFVRHPSAADLREIGLGLIRKVLP